MPDYWKIDKSLVKRVADNARLKLNDEELENFTNQLSEILKTFRKLDEVDTKNVKPSFHPIEMKNVIRDDKAEGWKWDPLANAKHKEERYFKGPKIV